MDISSYLQPQRALSGGNPAAARPQGVRAGRSFAESIRESGESEAARQENLEKQELVRQLADPESAFYTNMRLTLRAQVEKTREDEEQQAIVDALAAVIDALSGKENVSGEKASVNRTASELTKKMGDRIARLKREDPYNPEIVKLEQMLKRLQEIGVYFDLGDIDDPLEDGEEEVFETLTQFLTRRQAEAISTESPEENEVSERI